VESFLSRISRSNVRVAREYLDYLKAGSDTGQGAKGATLAGNAQALWRLDMFLAAREKKFEEVTRKDLEAYFASMKTVAGGPMKESSKGFHRAKVATFYRRWFNTRETADKDGSTLYQRVASWIKAKRQGTQKTAEEMLSPEEVRRLIEAARTPRDRAVVATLYDSGLRFNEFLNLRVGDVVVEENGLGHITLPEGFEGMKSGRRDVFIFESLPYLTAWMNLHPERGNPRAPLWPPVRRGGHDRPVNSFSLSKTIHGLAVDAKIRKRVHPHLLRHSRATELASRNWNEEMLRRQFGWSKSSPMPSYYVHLAKEDVKQRMLEEHGLVEAEERKEDRLDVRCYWCGAPAPHDATYCPKCSRPVSQEVAMELHRKARILDLEKEEKDLGPLGEAVDEDALVRAYRAGLRDALQLRGTAGPPAPGSASAGRPSSPGGAAPGPGAGRGAPPRTGAQRSPRRPRARGGA
jgi:integrase